MKRSMSVLISVGISLVVAGCSVAGAPASPSPLATATSQPSAIATATASASPSPSAIPTPSPATSSPPAASPSPRPTASPTGTITLRAYFFLGGQVRAAGLVPVLRELPETKQTGIAAMNALLAGPNAKERGASPRISTTIPEGTRLLGLSIEDGLATVDLSSEFESGGGSASCLGRLGQVVYTLTQFRTVDEVAFRVEGRPVRVFGCEGIVLDGPVGRKTDRFGQTMFEDLLPAIFVDRPAWGAALDNPVHVIGTANTYEAWLLVSLYDASGKQLYERAGQATCGTGCRGTFDLHVEYSVSKAQWGTLRVLDGDESGETEGISRDYRVWLLPGPPVGGHTCGC
jgi:hypothetical protein